jgi:hypothetical protein
MEKCKLILVYLNLIYHEKKLQMWKADGNMGDNPIEGYADLQF